MKRGFFLCLLGECYCDDDLKNDQGDSEQGQFFINHFFIKPASTAIS